MTALEFMLLFVFLFLFLFLFLFQFLLLNYFVLPIICLFKCTYDLSYLIVKLSDDCSSLVSVNTNTSSMGSGLEPGMSNHQQMNNYSRRKSERSAASSPAGGMVGSSGASNNGDSSGMPQILENPGGSGYAVSPVSSPHSSPRVSVMCWSGSFGEAVLYVPCTHQLSNRIKHIMHYQMDEIIHCVVDKQIGTLNKLVAQ